MDIYFCDLCGVRVTDADLHAGHGMRDGHEVICSGCLELGHHQEWLNRRVKAKPMAASGLGEQGDRVATLEEGVPSARVPPVVIAGDLTPSGAVPVLPDDHNSTTKVPTLGQPTEMPLAGAASLFSALGAPPNSNQSPAESDEDDQDDLLDQADHPRQAASSPFAEKAETALYNTEGALGKSATEEAPAVAEAPPASRKSTGKTNGSSISSRHAKASKSKSSRRTKNAPGQDVGRMILTISLISLGVIVLLFGGVIAKKKGWFGKAAATTSVGVDGDEIKAQVQSTLNQVVTALRAKDVAQLEAARAAIERTQTAVDTFEKTALHSGNTEEQINHFLERVAKWPDCYAMKRNVNEMLQILKSH